MFEEGDIVKLVSEWSENNSFYVFLSYNLIKGTCVLSKCHVSKSDNTVPVQTTKGTFYIKKSQFEEFDKSLISRSNLKIVGDKTSVIKLLDISSFSHTPKYEMKKEEMHLPSEKRKSKIKSKKETRQSTVKIGRTYRGEGATTTPKDYIYEIYLRGQPTDKTVGRAVAKKAEKTLIVNKNSLTPKTKESPVNPLIGREVIHLNKGKGKIVEVSDRIIYLEFEPIQEKIGYDIITAFSKNQLRTEDSEILAYLEGLKEKYPEKNNTRIQSNGVNTNNVVEIDSTKTLTFSILSKDNVLYIYKGQTRCHRNSHDIIFVTALLRNRFDKEVGFVVEYCRVCKKLLLHDILFEEYKKQHKILIGNFYPYNGEDFNANSNLAKESPLHLSGYNVSEKAGLTDGERCYILADIIYEKIMKKEKVIDYLTFFIERNGAKSNNARAVGKWKHDLMFVHEYDVSCLPTVAVKKILKYKK